MAESFRAPSGDVAMLADFTPSTPPTDGAVLDFGEVTGAVNGDAIVFAKPQEVSDGLAIAIAGRTKSVMTVETAYDAPDEIVVNGRRYVPAEE